MTHQSAVTRMDINQERDLYLIDSAVTEAGDVSSSI